jgi:hypothetical protein
VGSERYLLLFLALLAALPGFRRNYSPW